MRAAGRLKEKGGAGNPLRTLTSTYDAAGQLTGLSDPDATITFTYGNLGRPTSVTTSGPGLPSVTLTSSYDAVGNRTGLDDDLASAGITTYAYDALDRLTTISRTLGGNPGPQVVFAYDQASRLTALSRTLGGTGTAVTSAFAYDNLDRLTTLTHQVQGGASLASYAYGYDVGSRLIQETNAEGTATYAYDRTNQLTAVDRPTGQTDESYSYNANGGRNAAGYTTTAGNRTTAAPGFTYTDDPEGNRATQTETATGRVTTYAYDFRNRLTGVTIKDSASAVVGQATYTYDPLDRRVRVVVDSDGAGPNAPVTTATVYDGIDPYATVDGAGALQTRYLHGPAVDMLLARTSATGETAWYLTDRLGSVRDIASTAGTVIDHIAYDGFGRVLSESNPANGDAFKFTGRVRDSLTGLQYNWGRYYDAALGVWTQEDKIRFGGNDPNLYRYVGNGPTNAIDPSGLKGWGGWLSDTYNDAYNTVTAFPGAVATTFASGAAFDSSLGMAAGLWDHMAAPVAGFLTGGSGTHDFGTLYGHEGAFQGGQAVGNGAGYAMDAALAAYGGAGRAVSLPTSLKLGLGGGRPILAGAGVVGLTGGAGTLTIPLRGAASAVNGAVGAAGLLNGALNCDAPNNPNSPIRTGKWGAGSHGSAEDSLRAHFAKHGREVGATDVDQYLRKAEGFAQNLRGATKSPVPGATPGVTRYKKLGKYIDLDSNGNIISFGRQ